MLEDALNFIIGLAGIATAAWRLPGAIQEGAWYDAAAYLVVVVAVFVSVAIELGLAIRAVRRSNRPWVAWSENHERAIRKAARSGERWSKASFAVFALVPASLLLLVIKEAVQAALHDANDGRWWDAAYVVLTCGAVTGLWAYRRHVAECFHQVTVDHAQKLSPLFVATALSKAAGKHPNPGPVSLGSAFAEKSAAYAAGRTLEEYLERRDLSKLGPRFERDSIGVKGELIVRALSPTPPGAALVTRIMKFLEVSPDDRIRVAKAARALLPGPARPDAD